jgi:transposase
VGRSCNVSPSTVHDTVARARLAGLSWPLPDDMDDAALEALLYPGPRGRAGRPEPDYPQMYRELKRKGVTLQLLWLEYREDHPDDGLGYSCFCGRYRRWRKQLDLTMRQEHQAGEKVFVDYAGQTIGVTDPLTGEVTDYQVFVATLGASNFTYVEVHEAQSLRCWVGGHMRAFEYFHGVSAVTVPDNLKAGVTKACLYEPDINPTYQEMAEHYDTVVIPTRKRKPRDKAKVENGVQQVERWVLAPLRNQTFHNVAELRTAIAERREWLNDRPLSKLAGTRRSLWREIDRPALKPLPAKRFEMCEWKPNVGVNIDYHIEFDGHYYSVPYTLRTKRVDVRATATTVECIFRSKRVASHLRSYQRGRHTTKPEHMPSSHRRHAEWSPSRLIRWASTIGPNTAALVEQIMQSRPHPEQGYRSCLGILRLAKRHSPERLEAACTRACRFKTHSYRSVESILKTGLDRRPLPEPPPSPAPPIEHDNIRGAEVYN